MASSKLLSNNRLSSPPPHQCWPTRRRRTGGLRRCRRPSRRRLCGGCRDRSRPLSGTTSATHQENFNFSPTVVGNVHIVVGYLDPIQPGAATCSEGFVICFWKVTLACLGSLAAAVQPNGLGNSQKKGYKTVGTSFRPRL